MFTNIFKMPHIRSNYYTGIKIGTEVLNPLPGYVAVMINIRDLRMIIIGTGLFTLEHFSMLLNFRYMFITDHECASKQPHSLHLLHFWFLSQGSPTGQKLDSFQEKLVLQECTLQTLLVLYPQPQIKTILEQKVSRCVFMQECHVFGPVSVVTALSIGEVTSVTLLANADVVIVSLTFSSWCIYFIQGVLSEADKLTNALFWVNSIYSMSAIILKQQ